PGDHALRPAVAGVRRAHRAGALDRQRIRGGLLLRRVGAAMMCRFTILAAGLLVAIAACSPGGGSDGPAAAGPPVSGGTLTVGTNGQEPTCLDPHGNSSTLGSLLAVPFSDSLVRQAENGALRPWLGESWDIALA